MPISYMLFSTAAMQGIFSMAENRKTPPGSLDYRLNRGVFDDMDHSQGDYL